jgi:hypothetical protein
MTANIKPRAIQGARRQWLMLVILTTQEADMRRIAVQSQLQAVCKTSFRSIQEVAFTDISFSLTRMRLKRSLAKAEGSELSIWTFFLSMQLMRSSWAKLQKETEVQGGHGHRIWTPIKTTRGSWEQWHTPVVPAAWEDHLSSGVQGQPRQHSKDPSHKNNNKKGLLPFPIPISIFLPRRGAEEDPQ